MKFFFHLGRYFILIYKSFSRPEKFKIYIRQIIMEVDFIGIQSLGIIAIISVFMGAVVVIHTARSLESPLLPLYYISYAARQSVILEFSSTVISLILAGKVGSRIASEIGTMRVTEQIDALEIMGVNSAAYLIFPKIVAAVFIFPFVMILSMFIAIWGGYVAGVYGGLLTTSDFYHGLQLDFDTFDVTYSVIKMAFFGFAIASIPAYHGYYAYGGALDVGRASTKAVVYTSIVILIINYLITQILLT